MRHSTASWMCWFITFKQFIPHFIICTRHGLLFKWVILFQCKCQNPVTVCIKQRLLVIMNFDITIYCLLWIIKYCRMNGVLGHNSALKAMLGRGQPGLIKYLRFVPVLIRWYAYNVDILICSLISIVLY